MIALQEKALKIGVAEAHTKKRIVPAVQSKKMMQLIKENSKKIGDCVSWIKAYNNGVAAEIGVQTVLEI